MINRLNRRDFLGNSAAAVGSLLLGGSVATARAGADADPSRRPYQVGVYYFPNYHVDSRNAKRYGAGWTEWELIKRAKPRFAGHRQPRTPAWGYADEADPKAMEKKIDAAADHGIDYWIFDWYWYDDGPFLDRCLEKGYFGAANCDRVKFCCMWANHDWIDIFPARRSPRPKLLYPGSVKPETFARITDHVVDRYFHHPSHWKIDGRPYFSIYDLTAFLRNFGSLEATVEAVRQFREKTKGSGFPDLHLNAVVWGQTILPGESQPASAAELVARLGFDSVTSYVWVHHVALPQLETDYGEVQGRYFDYWKQAQHQFQVPYFPNVSVGWDPSPRTDPSEEYGNFGYPFTNTISGNSPKRFREALLATRQRLDQQPGGPRILNINSWNEWTEGSYLEPDTHFGTGYLEAVREVFG